MSLVMMSVLLPGAGRADEPGRRNVVKMDGFDEAGHPQRFDERAARDLQRRRSLRRIVIGIARADTADDGKGADQHSRTSASSKYGFFIAY